jgi:hypothetical protein
VICNFATQKLLPESSTQHSITPRIVILHSAGSKGSLYNFFKNSSNLESHFWVGGDGTIEQYINTNVKADANLKANSFAISIETESTPSALEPWTAKQIQSIISLVDWCCHAHNIPRQQVKTWDGSGIGWHVMFGSPGPWTPVAKVCPGPARIEQIKEVVIPRVIQMNTNTSTVKDDDMTEDDRKKLNAIYDELVVKKEGNLRHELTKRFKAWDLTVSRIEKIITHLKIK